jgi:hypothetical protein
MRLNFRIGKILFIILSICLISVVSAATLKNNAYYLNKEQSSIHINSPEKRQAVDLAKKEYTIAGFKLNNIPERQSYVLFISGFFGIIGIGWIKKSKSKS